MRRDHSHGRFFYGLLALTGLVFGALLFFSVGRASAQRQVGSQRADGNSRTAAAMRALQRLAETRPARLMALASAAPDPTQSAVVGSLRARNLADQPRTGIVSAIIPFPQGAVQVGDLPGFSVARADVSALEPFGAPWPDGSARYARAIARVPLDVNEDAIFDIVRTPPTGPPFRFADSFLSTLGRFRLQVACDGHVGELDPGSPGNAVLEINQARIVVRYRSRVPGTPLLVEWILCVGNDSDAMQFSARVVNSDPRDPLVRFNLQRLALRVTACLPVVRHANRLKVKVADAAGPLAAGIELGSYEVELLTNDYLADGQGIRVDGSLLFLPSDTSRYPSLIAESQFPILAHGTGWAQTGAWGPFGVVADPPPWMTDPNMWAENTARGFLTAPAPARWVAGLYGLASQSGQTGFQPDFGSCQGPQALANPILWFAVQDSVIRECFRPLHWFEVDTSNVLAANHPQLRVWDGRPHFDPNVSPDQLGKTPRQWLDSHNWSGPDNQHWSFLWLCAYALATGDYATIEEIRTHVQVFLSGQNTAPPLPNGWPTTGLDSPRAVARTFLTSAWYLLLTNDDDLRVRINKRLDLTLAQQWQGQDPSKPIRPIGTILTDNRQWVDDGMPIGTQAWTWQDPIGVTGLTAAYNVTGNAKALEVAKAAARTWTVYAYRGDPRTDGECIAYAAYKNGTPFNNAVGEVIWAGGTDFRTWASPAVILAKRWSVEAGDAAWTARCGAIIEGLTSRRVRPSDGGWDQFSVWAGGVK